MLRSVQLSIRPVQSHRRYLQIAQQLMLAIARGDFPPGVRLPSDRDLATQAKVSRPTAREAVFALELLGAVEVRPGDGVYAAPPGVRLRERPGLPLDSRPRELIETRAHIEPVVASLAAARMDQRRQAQLRELVDQTATLVDDVDQLPEFVRLGLQFHARLAPGCGNRLLADIVAELVDVEQHPLWTLVNQQAMVTREARVGQVSEHIEVLDMIAGRDPKAAAAAMSRHVTALQLQIFGSAVTETEQAS